MIFFLLCFSSNLNSQSKSYVYKYNGRYGIVSKNEKITEPIYYKIEPFSGYRDFDFTKFQMEDENGIPLFGILSKDGDVIIEPKYRKLEYDWNRWFAFTWDESNILHVHNLRLGKEIYQCENARIEEINGLHSNHFVVIRSNQNAWCTLINENGKEIIRDFQGKITFEHYASGCTLIKAKSHLKLLYFDCHGNLTTSNEFYDKYSWPKDDDQELTIKMPQKHLNKKLSSEKNRIEELQSTQDLIKVKDIYCNSKTDPYYGLVKKGHLYGLTNLREGNKLVLKPNYRMIRYSGLHQYMFIKDKDGFGLFSWDTVYRKPIFKRIVLHDRTGLFYVEHHSGYSGYINPMGEILLPKECECLD